MVAVVVLVVKMMSCACLFGIGYDACELMSEADAWIRSCSKCESGKINSNFASSWSRGVHMKQDLEEGATALEHRCAI